MTTTSPVRGSADAPLVRRLLDDASADRVVALPRAAGRFVEGLPHDREGFVPVDRHGVVDGLERVYAAGDITTFAFKQGGLATQQADVVAAAIAGVAAPPAPRVLRARLAGADGPLYLRAELDERGAPVPGTGDVDHELPWWPAGKVVGRHLSACLAGLEPVRAAA
jgi:sulfide:quinone oxidoreductase